MTLLSEIMDVVPDNRQRRPHPHAIDILAQELLTNSPDLVLNERLNHALLDHREDGGPLCDVLKINVYQLRRRLKPHVRIDCEWRRCYRMVIGK